LCLLLHVLDDYLFVAGYDDNFTIITIPYVFTFMLHYVH